MIRGAILDLLTGYYLGKTSHIKGVPQAQRGREAGGHPAFSWSLSPLQCEFHGLFKLYRGGRRTWITESQPWTSHGPAVTDRKGVVGPLPSCLHPGPDQGCIHVF